MAGTLKKIAFFNWQTIAYRDSNPNGAVVSIRNPGTEPPDFDPGWKAIHTEAFHDIDSRYGDFKLMTLPQAMRILQFMEEQVKSGVSEIAIHCHDGVSRSAAVAVFAGRRFGIPIDGDTGGRNVHVLKLMERAYTLRSLLTLNLIGLLRYYSPAPSRV